ncbi:MAG: flagellar biosynthesis protein FliQ [Rhodospirillales bacterium]|nr:flagellar biosynthesis protein FliQ [Rhodospirillales bacterium]
MTEAELLDISRTAFIVMMKVSAPALLGGLVIGLVISVFQAATQIQEMTLTFVPKVIVIFMTLVLFAPFMLHSLQDFTLMMMDRIISGGE